MNVIQSIKKGIEKHKEKKEINALNKANGLSIVDFLTFFDGKIAASIPFYYCFDAAKEYAGNPSVEYDYLKEKFYIPLKNNKKLYIPTYIKEDINRCMNIYIAQKHSKIKSYTFSITYGK